MITADVIVGGCFGDEGKGKLVAALCRDYDVVMRVNASTNAGHRVHDGTRAFVTRQLPSVFFPERTLLVIAPGALLNLPALAEELQGRPDRDALRGKVKVASSISLVLPPYIEKGQGGMSTLLGSTHQGTGPSAVARAARHSLHLYDLRAPAEEVGPKIRRTCRETRPELDASDRYCDELLAGQIDALRRVEEIAGDFCIDYTAWLAAFDGRVLIEGCNGLLLDNLHGAHPHVTSTSTNLGAMLSGAHLPPACARRAIVVIAAYASCLGKRPFPTELSSAESEHFRTRCDEVDPAQGRPRRLGWLDLPGLRKSLSGCAGAEVHLNKLDVLSGLRTIRVCTRYAIDGREFTVMPDDPRLAARAAPRYVELDGWNEPLADVRRFDDLPPAARRYVEFVARELAARIASIGVGPRTADIIRTAATLS